MAIFCIPKHLVASLKEAALKGEMNIEKLVDMSSSERRKFFTERTDNELGKFINTEFEKAIISSNKNAMVDWANSVFDPKAKEKPIFKSVLDKINDLDQLGVLDPATEKAVLEDFVSDKLGIPASVEEIHAIDERAKKIQAAQEKLGDDLGNPEKAQENIDFFKAKKSMDDYLASLIPENNLKIATGTIGRGAMLASAKSPILNIISNIEVGLTEAISRRLSKFAFRGTDNKLALDYVRFARRVYKDTGFDVSRMMSLADTGGSASRVLGDVVNTQGKGVVRATARVVEDIVFKNLMGAPDAAFASAHFADSVNINALKMAKGNVDEARALMVDAMRISPQTAGGELLRGQGVMDAQVATWTNKSWASDFSLGIRKLLNKASGDVRVGDFLMPFVKTPANVISTSADYAGLGAIKAVIKTVESMRNGKFGSEEYTRSVSRDLVRSGIGLLAALIFATNIKDEDFVGAYDPSRAQFEELRGSNYNAVRIGGKWVSLDIFGPLSIAISSIMYARKYGSTQQERTFQYGKGILSSLQNLPGVTEVYDFVKTQQYKKDQTLAEMTSEASDYALDQIYSRLVPSLVSDIAKATDKYQRETGGDTVSGIKSKIPGVRETLPVKQDVFGRNLETEPSLSTILFGARVKTDKEDAITREIGRVMEANGTSVAFTDWDRSSSKKLSQFKEEIGSDEFAKATTAYGGYLRDAVTELIDSTQYQNLDDDKKLEALRSVDTDATDKVFRDYGFRYRPERTSP